MNKEIVISGNLEIARFENLGIENFGGKIYVSFNSNSVPPRVSYLESHNILCLEYYTSFDWLLPVVERAFSIIEKEVYPSNIESVTPAIRLWELSINTPVEKVWSYLVDFIKWYNLKFKKTESES